MKGRRICGLAILLAMLLQWLPAAGADGQTGGEIQGGIAVEAHSGTETITVSERVTEGELRLSAETQHIQRDYDQRLTVQVRNPTSDLAISYYLTCDNGYSDLYMNFVHSGAVDEPLTILPGETQDVELSVFAQNAQGTSYQISITAVTVDTGAVNTLELPFTCEPPEGLVQITQGETDPETLAVSYTVENVGTAYITDLNLSLSGEAGSYAQVDPIVENCPLAVGESITVRVVPDLLKMKEDGVETLNGSLTVGGGAALADQEGSPSLLSTSVQGTGSGAPISLTVNPTQVKTIPVTDLALLQAGNPYYDMRFDDSKFRLTSSSSGQTVDLGQLSQQYYVPGDLEKDGVNTAQEFQEVMDLLFHPDTGMIDWQIEGELVYHDGSVPFTIQVVTQPADQAALQTLSQPSDIIYDPESDTATLSHQLELSAEDYDQMLAGMSGAADHLGVEGWSSVSLQTAQTMEDRPNVLMTIRTIYGRAGDIGAAVGMLEGMQYVAEATKPIRMVSKQMDVAQTIYEIGKTYTVWQNPNATTGMKLEYGLLMFVKNVNTYVGSKMLTTGLATAGSAVLDGVGTIVGYGAGVMTCHAIGSYLENRLKGMEEQLKMPSLWFQLFGRQCSNAGQTLTQFYLPSVKSGSSDAGSEEGLYACLYESNRFGDGRVYGGNEKYSDEEFGGDSYRHTRTVRTNYRLNNQNVKDTQEGGLTNVSFVDLTEGADYLHEGTNTLLRDYDTDPGHYEVTSDTQITVELSPDASLGYVGSPASLPDVRALPDFAVYTENIAPEKTAILNCENTLTVTCYNRGNAGGWADVDLYVGETLLYHQDDVYIAPFSEAVFSTPWTPTQEENQLTVTLTNTTVGLEDRIAENNQAQLLVIARNRQVPEISSIGPASQYFEDTASFTADITNYADVQSVSFTVAGVSYPAELTIRKEEQVLRASVQMPGLAEGTHTVSVDAAYHVTYETTGTVTSSAELTLKKLREVQFYGPKYHLYDVVVLRETEDGQLEEAPGYRWSWPISGSEPCKITLTYNPEYIPDPSRAYFVVSFSEGLMVKPLNELPGSNITIRQSEGRSYRFVRTDNETITGTTRLLSIDGKPIRYTSSFPMDDLDLGIRLRDGVYTVVGPQEITIKLRVTLAQEGRQGYVALDLKEGQLGQVTQLPLSDYYALYGFSAQAVPDEVFEDFSTSRVVVERKTRDGQAFFVISSAWCNRQSKTVTLLAPSPSRDVEGLTVGFMLDSTCFINMDLLSMDGPGILDPASCTKVSFEVEGESPGSYRIGSPTFSYMGQNVLATLPPIYLGKGSYTLTVPYSAGSGSVNRKVQVPLTVTGRGSTTVKLPPLEEQVNLAQASLLDEGEYTQVQLAWPQFFSSAALEYQQDGIWSQQAALPPSGLAAIPSDAQVLRLVMTGLWDSQATVELPVNLTGSQSSIAIGNCFRGSLQAQQTALEPNQTIHLTFGELLDAGGARLTGYTADPGGFLTGTVTFTSPSDSYTVEVTVADLSHGLSLRLPLHMAAGEYTYAVSLSASQAEETSSDLLYDTNLTGHFRYDYLREELALINAAREDQYRPPVTLDMELTQAAMERAAELAVYFSSIRPNGHTGLTIADGQSVAKLENIAIGYISVQAVMNAFTGSRTHLAKIVDWDSQSVGLGCFADRNGRLHWVQLFSDQEGDDTGIPTTSQPVVCTVESEARCLPSAVEAEELILEAGTAESIDATMPHVNPANEIFHSVLDLTYAASSDERVASVTLGENGRVTVEAHALGTAVLSLGMASTQGGQPLILRTVTVQVTGEEQVPILGLEEGTPQVGQLVIDNREVDTLRLTAQWTDGIPAQGSTLYLAHYDGQKLTAAYQGVFQDGQAVLPAVPAQALEGSYRLLILDGGLRPLAQPIGGS